MDKKNCKTGKRTKRQVEKILMVIDVKREIIDILQITNRRFMYNPQTGTLILGDEMYGKSICSSHAQEFHASQAEGRFDITVYIILQRIHQAFCVLRSHDDTRLYTCLR